MSTVTKKYVTAQSFDKSRIVFKPIVKHSTPAQYQTIPIRYLYDNNEEGPLIIRTHPVFTFGILENKSPTSTEVQSYSYPLVSYDRTKGQTVQDTKFISMIEDITAACRSHVSEKIKKNRRKRVDIDSMSMLKYKEDESVKYAPTVFVKLLTKYKSNPLIIETVFRKIVGTKIVEIDPMSCIRKKIYGDCCFQSR